jgi:hypothetical protein
MTDRDLREYTELRATIRQRGTARVAVVVAGVAAWAALAAAAGAVNSPPVVTLIPLTVLAAAFEGAFALHVGVERIGRYLAVFFDDRWEHVAGRFGRPAGAIGLDPLFTAVFGIAGVLNMIPAMIQQPTRDEWIFVAGAHALFMIRMGWARLAAGRQRAVDRARFEALAAEKTDDRRAEALRQT